MPVIASNYEKMQHKEVSSRKSEYDEDWHLLAENKGLIPDTTAKRRNKSDPTYSSVLKKYPASCPDETVSTFSRQQSNSIRLTYEFT